MRLREHTPHEKMAEAFHAIRVAVKQIDQEEDLLNFYARCDLPRPNKITQVFSMYSKDV